MWTIRKIVHKGDYDYAVVPEHPKASQYGYVLHHRIVAENLLGRLLNDDEVVHHVNEDKKDNRPENLWIVPKELHKIIHDLSRGKKYCTLVCPNCHLVFEMEYKQSFIFKGSQYTACSRRCGGQFSADIQYNGLQQKHRDAMEANLIRVYTRYQNDLDAAPILSNNLDIAPKYVN